MENVSAAAHDIRLSVAFKDAVQFVRIYKGDGR